MNRTWRSNRLGAPGINDGSSKGLLSMADNKENEVPVITQPGPSKLEQVLKTAKVIGIVAGVVISAVLTAVASGGIALPAGVVGVLQAILGLLAAGGLASNGVQKAPAPRVGPPAE